MDKRVKREMNHLFTLLSSTLLAGLIEKQTYDVGVQILRKFIEAKATTIYFTWAELMDTPVAYRGVVVADRASDMHFYLYGALQQLQERLGVITHVCPITLSEQAASLEDGQVPPNFTGEPGMPSLVVMPDTVIYCIYEPSVSVKIGTTVGDIWADIPKTHTLPGWVGAAQR